MAAKTYITFTELITFDSSALTTSYQPLNATGFSTDVYIFKMYNGSDQDITISYDGSTDHDFLAAGATFIIDFASNSEGKREGLRKGQQIWVKGAGAGTGNIRANGYSRSRC